MKDFFKTLASDEALKRKVIRASLFFILATVIIIAAVVIYVPDQENINNEETNQIAENHVPDQRTIIEDKKTVYDFSENEKNRINRDQQVASQERYFNMGEEKQEDNSTPTPIVNNTPSYSNQNSGTDPFAEYTQKRNANANASRQNNAQSNYSVSHSQYGTKDMWSVERPNQQSSSPVTYNQTATTTNTAPAEVVSAPVVQSKKDLFERGSKANSKGSNFSASIRGTQDLKAGQILRFQTDEEFFINGERIPKNTALFGVLSIAKYRAEIYIENANIGGKIIAVNLSVYGNDGIKGIPIFTDEPIKDARDKTVNEASKHATGSGIVGTAASILGGVVSTKAKDPVVKFIDNQKIILVHNKKSF